MTSWRRMLLLLSLVTLPCVAAAAGIVEQQQELLHKRQSQWRTINLPPTIDAPDTILSPYDSGVSGAWLRIHNADIYFQGGVGFHAINVVARLTPNQAGGVVNIDQPDSFSADIAHGCVIATEAQLTALFNEHILDYVPRPLNDLQITTEPGALTIHGEIKLWDWFPLFWMPLYLTGPITLNDQGQLVFTPDRIDVLKLRTQLLLHATNLPLGALISVDSPGVKISGQSIILDVTEVFPTPHINQAPTSVTAVDDGVKLCFSERPDIHLEPPAFVGDSYIWIQAGDMSAFGKLLINPIGAIRPLNRGKILRFHLRDYRKQVAAGYLTMNPNGALLIYVPSQFPAHDASGEHAGDNG